MFMSIDQGNLRPRALDEVLPALSFIIKPISFTVLFTNKQLVPLQAHILQIFPGLRAMLLSYNTINRKVLILRKQNA